MVDSESTLSQAQIERRLILLGLGSIAFIVALAGMCLWAAGSVLDPSCNLGLKPGDHFDFFSRFSPNSEYSLSIDIPASARNFGSNCYSVQDHTYQVWFDFDPTDLEDFLFSTGVDQPLGDPPYPPYFGSEPRGGESAEFLYGGKQCEFIEGRCYLVLWIETSDPKVYRVYVEFGYGS